MKRKTLILLFAALSLSFTVFAYACGGGQGTAHTHAFTEKTIKAEYIAKGADCTNAATYYYSCACGAKGAETFEHGDKLPHKSSDWIIDKAATYEETGEKHKECTVCKKILEREEIARLKKDEKDEIIFKTINFDGDKKANLKISNGQTTFNIKDEISANGKSQFVVSESADGSDPITSETITLECGDNVIYIIETVDGKIVNVYVITIYRRFIYTIMFNTNGGGDIANQQVEEDSYVTEPTTVPTKPGYAFDGWDYDFTKPVDGVVTVNAKWKANTDTKYVVEYYLQNVEDDDYTREETAELNGTTDTTVSADQKTFEHFDINSEKSSLSGNIKGDGSLVLKVYYTRKIYEVKVETNNEKAGTVEGDAGAFKYGSTVTVKAVAKSDSTFSGWYNDGELVSTENDYTFTVEKSVTLTAKWVRESSQGLKYTLSADKTSYSVAGIGTCTDTDIVIPSEYDGKKVVAIEDRAFGDCDDIESVELPDGIEKIGHSAFAECAKLIRVEFPDSITSIGNFIFYDCGSLCDVKLGKGITNISEKMFFRCNSLKSIVIPENVTIIKEEAFGYCVSLENADIKDGVIEIGKGAFEYCESLKRINLGNNIKYIRQEAFWGSGLISVTLPASVEIIEDRAFICNKLVEVINKSRLEITKGDGSFGGIAEHALEVKKVGESAIKNKDGFLFYKIEKENYLIGYDGQSDVLILPESYNGENYRVNTRAFSDCRWLKSVTIPKSVTSIDNLAFYDCDGLIEVVNNGSLNIVKGSTENGGVASYALKVIKNGKSEIENVDGYLFYKCDDVNYLVGYDGNKTQLVLPENYKGKSYVIYRNAFYGRKEIKELTVSSGASNIGARAFKNCTRLEKVIIEDGVATIADNVFENDNSLLYIKIGSGINSIGYYAFYNNRNLKRVDYNGTRAQWNNIKIKPYNTCLFDATINFIG